MLFEQLNYVHGIKAIITNFKLFLASMKIYTILSLVKIKLFVIVNKKVKLQIQSLN